MSTDVIILVDPVELGLNVFILVVKSPEVFQHPKFLPYSSTVDLLSLALQLPEQGLRHIGKNRKI